MKTYEKVIVRRFTVALTSFTLLAALAPAAVQAQDNNSNNTTGQNSNGQNGNQNNNNQMNTDRNRGRRGDRRMDNMNNSGMNADLGPYAYRYADLGPSVEGDLQTVMAERQYLIRPDDEDPVLVDPAPWNYPNAAPGAVDLYHWVDYTRNQLEPGSIYNIRHEKERILEAANARDRRRLREMRRNMAGMGTDMNGGTR